MTSPPELVAEAVEAACGSPLASKTRVVEGFSNEVYAAVAADGQQVIVRIHWWAASSHFEAERWALAHCARLRLPTPRLLLLDHRVTGDALRSICVESRLPGTTLRAALNARTLRPADLRPVLVAAGMFLADLHKIPTTGFGRIDGTGVAPAPTWDAYRRRTARSQTDLAAGNLGISPAAVNEAMGLLDDASDLWKDVAPHLLHGDFTPQNVIVEGGRFSGVIDFEFPLGGDPATELATWDYYRHSPFHNPSRTALPTEWLLEGYARRAPADAGLARRLVGCRLQLGLDLLNYHGVRDDQEPRFLALIRTSFARDLAELRRLARAAP